MEQQALAYTTHATSAMAAELSTPVAPVERGDQGKSSQIKVPKTSERNPAPVPATIANLSPPAAPAERGDQGKSSQIKVPEIPEKNSAPVHATVAKLSLQPHPPKGVIKANQTKSRFRNPRRIHQPPPSLPA
jgi:hypothetical protein